MQQTSQDGIAVALDRDGAAVVRGVVPMEWIERMRVAIDCELAGASPTAAEYGLVAGRFYGDFFLWLRNADFRDFALSSPLPALAARTMNSETVNLFYDQLFVKEPGSVERTPWHQDLPYWPVSGEQVVSIWVPFDAATPENGVVTYIKGSHRWGKTYQPRAFDDRNAGAFAASAYDPMPDIEADPRRFDFLSWSLEPGDVLLHKGLTVHGAPGNRTADRRRRALAVRYTGDDARYTPRPGTFMDMASVRAHVPAPGLADGGRMAGPLFPRAWPPIA
jgi:ectoine hydroxylase-related dioxygenase (phytanoyl-CoA dioxygenase family)